MRFSVLSNVPNFFLTILSQYLLHGKIKSITDPGTPRCYFQRRSCHSVFDGRQVSLFC